MTKNPLVNAVAAFLYITAVAWFMFYGSRLLNSEKTMAIPVAMISLFTLSAAVMGYLFVYQPFQFLLDGHKKQGVNLFLQTVAAFAGITVFVFALLFLGVFR